jgi:hypothetical protein
MLWGESNGLARVGVTCRANRPARTRPGRRRAPARPRDAVRRAVEPRTSAAERRRGPFARTTTRGRFWPRARGGPTSRACAQRPPLQGGRTTLDRWHPSRPCQTYAVGVTHPESPTRRSGQGRDSECHARTDSATSDLSRADKSPWYRGRQPLQGAGQRRSNRQHIAAVACRPHQRKQAPQQRRQHRRAWAGPRSQAHEPAATWAVDASTRPSPPQRASGQPLRAPSWCHTLVVVHPINTLRPICDSADHTVANGSSLKLPVDPDLQPRPERLDL